MTWFKVDDSFAFHSKAVMADGALSLWVRAGAWSSQQLTDGFIPDHMLPLLGGVEKARRLVEVGLWFDVDGGYQFHDWVQYQPTGAEVRDKRAKRAEAGAKGGLASGQSRRSKTEANASASASSIVEADACPIVEPPTRPDPTRSVSNETESAADAAADREDIKALCDHLRRRVVANGSRVNITAKWRDAARLLLDRDKRPIGEAHALIDWCQDNDFWRPNIQAMPKFREKYDTLRLQAQSRGGLRVATVNGERSWSTSELDALLGPDMWRCPQPPTGLTGEEMWEWEQRIKREHRADRIREAQTKAGAA